MNPLLTQALAALIRWALAFGAGYLVEHGVWAEGEASTYVAAATMALLSIGWSLWQKWKSRVVLKTALTMPAGATEQEVNAKIAIGGGANV